MQLMASLVSVLLLVWSVRATALPGEERLAIQNSGVSIMHPMQGLGEGGAGRAGWSQRTVALPDANNFSTPLYSKASLEYTSCTSCTDEA